MRTSTTTTSWDTDRNRFRELLVNDWFAAVVAAAIALALGHVLITEPARVDLELVNPTDHDISVAVRGDGDDGWRMVGTVEGRSERLIEDVIDRGHTWSVRFRGQGRQVGEVTVSRSDLVADGWTFEIPPAVGQGLTASGG